MKKEIKLIGRIENFKGVDIKIYHDPLSKDLNAVNICWQMRNPESAYTGIGFINYQTQEITYPDNAVIPEQTKEDKEIVPKFIITSNDTLTEEFIAKIIDELNYGFYERNIGEKNYLLCDFNDKQFKKYNLDNVESCINKLNDKINTFGVLFGELNYNSNTDISLQNISHSIKNLTFKDNKVYGDVKILNTIMGRNLVNIMNTTNYTPIFQLRAVHNKDTINEIFTFDIIDAPVDHCPKCN